MTASAKVPDRQPAHRGASRSRAPSRPGARQTAGSGDGIGQKLRDRRKVRQLPLAEVAEKAGLSIGLLSQIERGLSTPTLRSLNQICQALEMPVRWLFDGAEADAREDSVVVRLANRRRMDLGTAGMLKEILSTDAIRQLQLIRFIIQPGGATGVSPNQNATGAKAGTVLSGQLALEVDGRKYVLNRGDSFSFMASSSYSCSCTGDAPCELLWAVTPALY